MKRLIQTLLYIPLFCGIFFCLSCKEKQLYEGAELFSFEDFGTPIQVELTQVDLDDPPFIPRSILVHDSLLIIHSLRTENMIYIYNLNTGVKLNEFISFGSGPEELLSIWNMIVNDSLLWLHDIQEQSLQAYSLNKFSGTQPPDKEMKFRLEEPAEFITLICDSVFVSDMLNVDEKRLNFYNLEGKVIYKAGEYPITNQDMTPLEINRGFNALVRSTSELERIYLFCRTTDLIEVYDFGGNLVKRVQGPEFFYPRVKQRNFENNTSSVTAKKAKDAFFDAAIIGDELYAIYSGTDYADGLDFDDQETKYLFVFDKDVKPLRYYKFTKNLLNFSADTENRIMYITTRDDFKLKKFNY